MRVFFIFIGVNMRMVLTITQMIAAVEELDTARLYLNPASRGAVLVGKTSALQFSFNQHSAAFVQILLAAFCKFVPSDNADETHVFFDPSARILEFSVRRDCEVRNRHVGGRLAKSGVLNQVARNYDTVDIRHFEFRHTLSLLLPQIRLRDTAPLPEGEDHHSVTPAYRQ